MMKIIVVGNCQAEAIRKILRCRNNKSYNIPDIPRVDLMTNEDIGNLHSLLKRADIAVLQRITESYRGGGLGNETLRGICPQNCRVITYPNIYFGGYNPEMFYLHDKNGKTIPGFFGYHNKIIAWAYLNGKSPKETVEYLSDNESPIYLGNTPVSCLKSLKEREKGLDVIISDYIQLEYQRQRLFHSMNHPTNEVLLEVVNRIVNKLGTITWSEPVLANEFLGFTRFPILNSVKAKFGFTFKCDTSYLIQNKMYSPLETVTLFFEWYKKHKEILEINSERLRFRDEFNLDKELDKLIKHVGYRLPKAKISRGKGDLKILFNRLPKSFHVEIIPRDNGKYEYGIHIEDKSLFFLKETIIPRQLIASEYREILRDDRVYFNGTSQDINEVVAESTRLYCAICEILEKANAV